MAVAEKVAMASTEGGFLGFVAERVSADEKQLLNELEEALGVESQLAQRRPIGSLLSGHRKAVPAPFCPTW